MSILEALMLVCFGCAWPISIARLAKSRDSGGKSPLFDGIVIFGYMAGIANKLLRGVDWVMWLYMINIAAVTTDLILTLRFRKSKAVINPAETDGR